MPCLKLNRGASDILFKSQLFPLRHKKLFWINASILRHLYGIYRKPLSQLSELRCQNVKRSDKLGCCPCYHLYKHTAQKPPTFLLLKHGRLGLSIFKGMVPWGKCEVQYKITFSTFWKPCLICIHVLSYRCCLRGEHAGYGYKVIFIVKTKCALSCIGFRTC